MFQALPLTQTAQTVCTLCHLISHASKFSHLLSLVHTIYNVTRIPWPLILLLLSFGPLLPLFASLLTSFIPYSIVSLILSQTPSLLCLSVSSTTSILCAMPKWLSAAGEGHSWYLSGLNFNSVFCAICQIYEDSLVNAYSYSPEWLLQAVPFLFNTSPTCSTSLFSLDDVNLWSTEWAPQNVHTPIPGACEICYITKELCRCN